VKIVFLTPGTGSYYCGACMRDNTLAQELHRAGHDVTIAPMYLPLILDEATATGSENAPIFFGGINVYLQQKLALFRSTPAFVDRWLNATGLLRWAARHSHMTSAREHGAMALEMLHVETSPFRKEWDKLLAWLALVKPDLVCLSNALLAGFAAEMKHRFGAPVVVFFQGEDLFLDGLPEPFRTKCWAAMQQGLTQADLLLAPSRYYADFMRNRLGLPAGAIEVIHNGISLEGAAVATTPSGPATIGFLARMCREKGLEILVEAFVVLARDLGDTTTRLKIAGAATAGDERLIEAMKQRLAAAGLTARVEWTPNLSREQKFEFLRRLTLFSVPATYAEAFGLYVIEAMACGVPVVLPESAAFPEIVGAGGGGVCVPDCNANTLARAWKELLLDASRRQKLGQEGRVSVEKKFSSRTMTEQFIQVTDRLTRATA
jgi:glycosyltransferase involved in cell wall biosynthesis